MLHKLTKTNFFIFIFVSLLVIASIFTTFFALSYSVEATIKSQIEVDSLNNKKIYLNSNDGYLIRQDSIIVIKINNKFYNFQIDSMVFNQEKKLFVLKVLNPDIELLPNSTLEANIIYKTTTLFNILFNQGK